MANLSDIIEGFIKEMFDDLPGRAFLKYKEMRWQISLNVHRRK
jgi:transcriptional regulator CtsR